MPHTIDTAYLTLKDLEALLPAAFITEALDDDNDGVVDAADAVLIAASNEVDSYLENRYLVPVARAAAPATVITAAVHFAIRLCYARRGMEDKNPYKSQLKSITGIMERIRDAQQDLDLTTRVPADQEPMQILTEQAIAVGSGRLSF